MSGLWKILTKEEAIKKDLNTIKNPSIRKCVKDLKEYGEIKFDKSCLHGEDYGSLDGLLMESTNDYIISRGPIYYGVLRIPSISGEKIDTEKGFVNKIWKAEVLYSLNIIKESKNDIARSIASENLLESLAYLVLVLNRLIVEYNKSPENAFIHAIYAMSYAGEVLYSILNNKEPRSKVLSRLEYIVNNELFRYAKSLDDYFIQNSRIGNIRIKDKQYENVVIIDRFWRPREGMNEIRNVRYAINSKNRVNILNQPIDLVASILYGGATMIGPIIEALNEVGENALPAVIIFSRNEYVFNRSHRITSTLLQKYHHITKLWGSMYGRSVYIVDDSIGTGLTMAYATLLALYFTKNTNIDKYVENIKQEVINAGIELDVVQKIVLHKILTNHKNITAGAVAVDKKYLDWYLIKALEKMLVPPHDPRVSFNPIIERTKRIYKHYGIRAYRIPKAEFYVFIENPALYQKVEDLRYRVLSVV